MVTDSKELPINLSGTEQSPLRYSTCNNIYPKYDKEDGEAYDFEQFSIYCAPLYELVYNTEVRKVYQTIHIFVQGDTTEA